MQKLGGESRMEVTYMLLLSGLSRMVCNVRPTQTDFRGVVLKKKGQKVILFYFKRIYGHLGITSNDNHIT